MKEFMLLVRNRIDHQTAWPQERHVEFVMKCELYIGKLKAAGKLVSAQPLVREGVIVAGREGSWTELPFNETGEVQVGYYHILAEDLTDAVAIAKEDPEFAYSATARVEVRPIKTKEQPTGFTYPR